MKREKKGGSKQTGWLYGGHFLYDRQIPTGFYWGVHGYYTHGRLSGSHLKSDLSDRDIEGLLGFSLTLKKLSCFTFTPYAGYGYFSSTNDFHKSSLIPYKIHNWFQYGSVGFLSDLFFTPKLYLGFHFKAKYMLDGKSKITDDPDFNDLVLNMSDKIQYEAELPLRYKTSWNRRPFVLSIIPFYRFRHYGGCENHPFDFIDTKFHIYGVQLLISYCL